MALRILFLALLLVLSACYRTGSPHGGLGWDATYTVRSGDTLYSVGRRYGIDYKRLARRNRIRYPYIIHVGQRLYLTRTAPRHSFLPIPGSRRQVKSVPPKHRYKARQKASSRSGKPSRAGTPRIRLRWPVDGQVTSGFGMRSNRMHDGIDISVPRGTPVHAAAAGEVVYSDNKLSGYGRLIIIRHKHDVFTAYAHNQRNLVRKGNRSGAVK